MESTYLSLNKLRTTTTTTMAARGKQGAQSKYDHLIKLLLIGDSGASPWVGWLLVSGLGRRGAKVGCVCQSGDPYDILTMRRSHA